MTTTIHPQSLSAHRFTNLRVSNTSEHPSVRSKLKRCLDVIGALAGLGILALVLIPIAVAIKLDTPGPVFYSQMRCGYQGRCFRLWKFRSMIVNAEQLQAQIPNQSQGAIFKNHSDPRMTRVGRFLRKTSLDELPQFWNVLSGEMSLVGTRPPIMNEVAGYSACHWQRLRVKPGITGEWQVNGRSCVIDFETIVSMDLTYQRKWSIAYDLSLLLKTLPAVIARKGAC